MDNLFFNITNRKCKSEYIYNNKNGYLKRVDISNGIFYLDANITKESILNFKGINSFIMIIINIHGNVGIKDNLSNFNFSDNQNKISILYSTKQNFNLMFNGKFLIFFVADFFLNRYLSKKTDGIVDRIYKSFKQKSTLNLIDSIIINNYYSYFFKNLQQIQKYEDGALMVESKVLEILFILFKDVSYNIIGISKNEIELAKLAKDILDKNFINPPNIKELSRLCHTNETKLKQVFKKVYKKTIYTHVQNLKLNEAKILLESKNYTIGEVSKMVGYKHQGHFSKLFFKTFGISAKKIAQ